METVLAPAGVPSRDTKPVAALGVTEMLKLTLWPCVIETAVPLLSDSVVLDEFVGPIQLCTRLKAFTEPRPVARSYPLPALYPDSTPYMSDPFDVVQSRLPFAHGIA